MESPSLPKTYKGIFDDDAAKVIRPYPGRSVYLLTIDRQKSAEAVVVMIAVETQK